MEGILFDLSMERRIKECQTIAELLTLENQSVFNESEKRLLFERKMEIFVRIRGWRLENERLGLIPELTDTWTPEQRERFLCDWGNDEPQVGHGQKRSHEETINDDIETGQDDDAETSDAFTVVGVRQVNMKKFKTTGVDYHIRFTNAFANVELSEYHDRLHEIFQSLLDEVIRGVPPHDQVRFVLHSPQLEKPISFPFMPRQRLATERVLAEFERVIQSNHHFYLNESVDVNVVHVEMPHGGRKTKRA